MFDTANTGICLELITINTRYHTYLTHVPLCISLSDTPLFLQSKSLALTAFAPYWSGLLFYFDLRNARNETNQFSES